jgi:hypothetical protein
MASRHHTVCAVGVAILFFALIVATPPHAQACPFCTPVAPSLSQRRESAPVVALVEPLRDTRGMRSWQLDRTIKGPAELAEALLREQPDGQIAAGGLVLAFGSPAANALDSQHPINWEFVPVSETAYAYVMRAPGLRILSADRLPYFIPYLEHADPLIAGDAYLEFAHAPYDEVAKVADRLPMAKIRQWLADAAVPAERKGFYGLALGLAIDPAERQQNLEFLGRQLGSADDIGRAGQDFRAGFDGVLGGYLMLAGRPGLDVLVSRYFANPQAAEGDVRHALTALRFYHEYGQTIPAAEQCAALRHLLARAEMADQVITDLARWNDWDAMTSVAALYTQPGYDQPRVRRSIVGYLLSCPLKPGAAELARLRMLDPQGVAAAEQVLRELGGVNVSGASEKPK